MKLAYRCPNSRQTTILNVKASDRGELSRQYPNGIPIQCTECGSKHIALPNEVFATEGKFLAIIGGAGILSAFSLGGIFIWQNWKNVLSVDLYLLLILGGILAIPPLIANTFIKSQREQISAFNRYRL